MKVFVVVRNYGYEGHDVPFGVYSTMEKAEEAQELQKSEHYDVDIWEYSLDGEEDVD